MLIGNNKEITEYVLNTYQFSSCCNYQVTVLSLLIFGYIGGIVAWLYTSSSLPAIIADLIYTAGVLAGTWGLFSNNYFGLIGLLITFAVDVIVALFAMYYISQTDDLSAIIGDAKISHSALIWIFAFFAFVQTIFVLLLMRIIKDIQNQTSNGLAKSINTNK